MPLTERVLRDWCVGFLYANGIDVEYWDVSRPLRGELNEFRSISTEYLHTFHTYEDIRIALSRNENSNALFVMMISYSGRFSEIFRLLSSRNCRLIQIVWGALPSARTAKLEILKARISSPIQLALRIFYRTKATLYRKLGFVKPFEIVFAAGAILSKAQHFSRKTVSININDFEHYRDAILHTDRLLLNRYAVFLDDYLPYHTDLQLVGLPMLTPSLYYSSINRFFESLEKEFGIEIVVAAHPKARYEKNEFMGRKVFYGQTAVLMKDTEFCISHHSTSVSYAVLNRKPIFFVYTDQMMILYRTTIVASIYGIANYLNAPVINIDSAVNSSLAPIPEVDVACFDAYKYNFLTTPESENVKTEEILIRELDNYWTEVTQ